MELGDPRSGKIEDPDPDHFHRPVRVTSVGRQKREKELGHGAPRFGHNLLYIPYVVFAVAEEQTEHGCELVVPGECPVRGVAPRFAQGAIRSR